MASGVPRLVFAAVEEETLVKLKKVVAMGLAEKKRETPLEVLFTTVGNLVGGGRPARHDS